MDILWLSEKDVRSLLTMEEAMQAVEEAFREHGLGRAQMPPKSYLYYPQGDLRTMPAYLEGRGSTGVKIVNVHPGNPEVGLPTVMALMVLNSSSTGAPLAAMGATYLTAMRTGAAGGVAARLLSRPGSRVAGFVGAGAQARTQLLALSRVLKLETVRVADVSMQRCRDFERECRPILDCEYVLTTDIQEACRCDVLVTTTPSRTPLVRSEWIEDGTHINAIGADAKGKEELEAALLCRSRVVVDDMVQAVHSGEVNVPISQGTYLQSQIHGQIGEVVAGKISGREDDREITIFDSTGLAIQDVATATVVYEKARKSGRGTALKFM
ncbi:MAG: alanine dehydrogenase [Methanosarcinales archaeon]|nr:alanine dehydrogenase [Methanosarcinales archaeon]